MAFRPYQKPIVAVGGKQTGCQYKINNADQNQQLSLSYCTTRAFHPFQMVGTAVNNNNNMNNNTCNNMKQKAVENDTVVDCTLRLSLDYLKLELKKIDLNFRPMEFTGIAEVHQPAVIPPPPPPPPPLPQMRLAPPPQALNLDSCGEQDPMNRMVIRPCQFRSSNGALDNISNKINNCINNCNTTTENIKIGGGGEVGNFSTSVAVPSCPKILPTVVPGFLNQQMIDISSVSSFTRRFGLRQPRKRCSMCHTAETPLWHNGPFGLKTLCNACGIRYRKVEVKFKRDYEGRYRRIKQTSKVFASSKQRTC